MKLSLLYRNVIPSIVFVEAKGCAVKQLVITYSQRGSSRGYITHILTGI